MHTYTSQCFSMYLTCAPTFPDNLNFSLPYNRVVTVLMLAAQSSKNTVLSLIFNTKVADLWNIPLHHVNICHCVRFNKEADWPITEQGKVRWESQSENPGRKKGRVGSC